jgi:hypothetical protein
VQNVLIVDSEGKNNKVLEIIYTLSPEVCLEQHFSDHVEGIYAEVETNCTLELLFGTIGLSLEAVVDQSLALDAVEADFLEIIANADQNAFFLPNDLREAVVSARNDTTRFYDRFSELHVRWCQSRDANRIANTYRYRPVYTISSKEICTNHSV